jgi:hypothetical protein
MVQFYLNGMGLAGVERLPEGPGQERLHVATSRGFSEDLFGNGKTVLRGGFGTFFERMQGNDIYDAATNAPFAYNLEPSATCTSAARHELATGATAALPIFAPAWTNLAQTTVRLPWLSSASACSMN